METTYEKTEENRLRKIETVESVTEYSLADLRGMRSDLAQQIAAMSDRLDEIDALIATAEDLGIVVEPV